MGTSKFSSLVQAKQPLSQPPEAAVNASAAVAQPIAKVAENKNSPSVARSAPKTNEILDMHPPRGKKGHPDYNQVTLYLTKDTHNKAKIALLKANDSRDFSELVEELLQQFLATA